MKTIRVFIASSDELKLERLEFTDMIVQLNKTLKVYDIEIEPVKWEYLDSSMSPERKQTEYNNALRQCELCLVLYWTKFGEYTEEEFNVAYEGLKSGGNPRKLYIYFKETPDEITPELKDFKSRFATQYGHFYCKFENVDTMRLNFLLQFEQYHSTFFNKDDMIKVRNSNVEFCGQKIADLRNVPFTGNNPDYCQLQEDAQKLQQEIATFEAIQASTPNDAIGSLLLQKRFDREQLVKRIEDMEKSLMGTAKQIVSLSFSICNVRLHKAIELFEQGDNKGANAVLNYDEIKVDMEINARRFDEAKDLGQKSLEALKINIEECKLKVKTLITEKNEGWLQLCMGVYEYAIEMAKGRMEDEELAELFFEYADFLSDENQFYIAEQSYNEALELYRKLTITNIISYRPYVAATLNNLGVLYYKNNRFNEAKKEYDEALEIYRDLAVDCQAAFLPGLVADTYNNLGIIYDKNNRYEEAEKEYNEALDLYREEAVDYQAVCRPKIATTLNNLGVLHCRNNRYEEAEKELNEALEIYCELAIDNHDEYRLDVATTLGNLGNLHADTNRYVEAEKEFNEALEICRELAIDNPVTCRPNVASALGVLGNLHADTNRYVEAEKEYIEALDLYREEAVDYQAVCHPKIATTLNNLGVLHCKNNRYEEAEKELNEALEIYCELAIGNHDEYRLDVATTLSNLGGLHYKNNRYEEAGKEYNEALKIYRDLAKSNQELYISEVARMLNHLSYCYWNLGKSDDALITIESAINTEPDKPEFYDSKGEFVIKLGRTEEALEIHRHILSLDERYFDNTDSEFYKYLLGIIS